MATGAPGHHSADGHGGTLADLIRVWRSLNQRNRVQPPAGYDGFIAFLENGTFDPTMPNPEVPGCFQFFCSGDYYHTAVRGRSLAQVDAIEANAKLFFIQRFGVDVNDPDNMGKLFFRRYYRDPRANLNAYLVSDRSVPREGWKVDDAGWDVIFLEDYTLGGEFSGATVGPGSTLSFGEYVITPDRPRAGDPIVLSYRSAIPPLVRFTSGGLERGFQNELYRGALDDPDNDWGNSSFPHQGLDQGIDLSPVGLSGEVKANRRHMLTFSEDGGL